MDLQTLQNWVKEDWQTRSRKEPTVELQLLYLIEEFGEVAECIRKMSGNKNRKQNDLDLGSEMADLLISVVTLANTFQVDLTKETKSFKKRLLGRQQQGF